MLSFRKSLFFVFVIMLPFFADAAVAAETAVESHENTDISFFQIVAANDPLGIGLWVLIFTIPPFSAVLGMLSCAVSAFRDKPGVPLPLKCLMSLGMFYFFIGAVGVMRPILSLYALVGAQHSGTTTVFVSIAYLISNSLYRGALTLLGIFPILFFIALSLVILHFRRFPPPLPAALNVSQEKEDA